MALTRNDSQLRDWIATNVPQFAFLLNNPDIAPILLSSAAVQEDPSVIVARVQATGWYRQRSQAAREFEVREATDPAQNQRLIQQMTADVRNMSGQLGLTGIDPTAVARDAVRTGMTAAEVQDLLSSYVTIDTTKQPGQASTYFAQAKQMGADYFVRIDDQLALSFAQRVAAGDLAVEDMEGWFRDRAKERFPWLGDILDKGISVAEHTDPIKQELAQILELNPESVDLMNDSRWWDTLEVTNDDGSKRAMTLTEVGDFARSRKEWRGTDNARQRGAEMATMLAKAFGRMGT